MTTLRIIKDAAKYVPQRAIVLSRKAQLFLMYHGEHIDEMNLMARLRDNYLARRDAESINKITAAEIENCIRYGLKLEERRGKGKKDP